MLRMIFLFAALFFSKAVLAQAADSLIGDWTFRDVHNAEKLDETKKETLRKVFSELRIDLKKGNQYSAYINKQEDGTWSFDPELRQLTLTSDGKDNKLKVLEITPTTFVMEFRPGKAFVMEKLPSK